MIVLMFLLRKQNSVYLSQPSSLPYIYIHTYTVVEMWVMQERKEAPCVCLQLQWEGIRKGEMSEQASSSVRNEQPSKQTKGQPGSKYDRNENILKDMTETVQKKLRFTINKNLSFPFVIVVINLMREKYGDQNESQENISSQHPSALK